MSNIDIRHAHSMDPAGARRAVQDIADSLAQRFAVQTAWTGDVLSFNRSGIAGHIALLPGEVHVAAQLGFLFSAMKGTIESEVRRVLRERLG